MKSFIVFTLAVLPFVYCAVDPTTICMPEKFSADVYDARRVVTGRVTVDFAKNIAASLYSDGVRSVVDTHMDMVYQIQPDSQCTRSPYSLKDQKQITRCLPATSVSPGEHSALGFVNDRLILQYWDVDYGNNVTAVLAFTTGTPAIPVLRQTYINGVDAGMIVYANPRMEVDTSLTPIPLICPDGIIV